MNFSVQIIEIPKTPNCDGGKGYWEAVLKKRDQQTILAIATATRYPAMPNVDPGVPT